MDTAGVCRDSHLDTGLLADIDDFIVIVAIRICQPDIVDPELVLECLIRLDDLLLFFCAGGKIVELGMRQCMTCDGDSMAVCHFLQLIPCHAVIRLSYIISDQEERPREAILLHERIYDGVAVEISVIESDADRLFRKRRPLGDIVIELLHGDRMVAMITQIIHLDAQICLGHDGRIALFVSDHVIHEDGHALRYAVLHIRCAMHDSDAGFQIRIRCLRRSRCRLRRRCLLPALSPTARQCKSRQCEQRRR